jgi:hypothetical protein
MKKILSLLVLSFLFSAVAFSQIDDIKKKSNDNKNNNNNNSSDNNIGVSPGDPCISSCASSAFELAMDFAINALAQYNNQLLQNSNDPGIISLEIMPMAGYGLHLSEDQENVYRYYDVLPRLRGNLGAFSTEVRLDYLFEANDSVAFNTFPVWNYWFGINIIPKDLFRLTIGQGLMYESNSRQAFHESFIGCDIPLQDRAFLVSPEFRFSYDYENQLFPYIEGGLRGSMRFVDTKHFFAYLTLGTAWRNYYQSHEVLVFYGGLTLNIH